MVQRILASVILLLSIIYLPLWVSAVLAVGGMFYFNLFWEAVFLFFLSDLLYGVEKSWFFNFTFVSSVLAALCLIILEFVKKKLKFYR